MRTESFLSEDQSRSSHPHRGVASFFSVDVDSEESTTVGLRWGAGVQLLPRLPVSCATL